MRHLMIVLISIIIVSCSTHRDNKLTENEKVQIQSELQSRMDQIIQNSKNADMEKSIEPYLDSPDFVSISNGQISDYANFKLANKQFYEVLKSQKFSNSTFTYTFLNKETVILTWGCSTIIQMKNEQEIKIDPYAATLIFKKINNIWKIIYGHGSGQIVPISPIQG